MNYSRALPYTGSGLLIGGVIISQAWVLGVALIAIISGALLLRYAWRRSKSIDAI